MNIIIPNFSFSKIFCNAFMDCRKQTAIYNILTLFLNLKGRPESKDSNIIANYVT